MTLKKGGSLLLLTLLLLPSQVHATPPSFDIDLKELDRKPAAAPKAEKKKAPKAKKPAAGAGKVAQPPTDTPEYVRYTVKPGDHIFKILVVRFGMSNEAAERLIPEIIRINNIPNIKSLTVGRTLLIPGKGAKGRAATSTKKVKSQKKRETAVAAEIPEAPSKRDLQAEIDSSQAGHPASQSAAPMRPVEKAPSAPAAVPAPAEPAPVVPTPVVSAPIVTAPVAPAPVAPAPVAPAPVAPAPVAPAPVAPAPVAPAPVAPAPVAPAPAAPAPAAPAPAAQAPAVQSPVAKAQVPAASAPPAPIPVPPAHAARVVSVPSNSNEIASGHGIPSANTWVCSVPEKDSGKMVDAVLNALSIPWSRNRIINSGDGADNTFSIMVDRYFEYRGARYIVILGDGDPYSYTLVRLLEGAGYRVLRVGSGEKFKGVGDKLLKLIGLAPDFGKHALQGGVETTGFLIQQEDAGGKRVVITGEHVDPRQKWLMAPGCGGKL